MNSINLKTIPQKPGVYIWKDKFENVIYVGKAKSLEHRMKQYFRGMTNSYKTSKLVSLIASYEYFITSSDKEALILERNLIEKYAPKYNILMTDDKRYPYIKIALRDKVEISLVYRIRSTKNNDVLLYGPFPGGFGGRKMVNLLNRLVVYKDGLPNKSKDYKYWSDRFDYVKELLTSNSKSLIKELEEKMLSSAQKQQYEIAHDIKESIKALRFHDNNQSVELLVNKNIDVIAFAEKGGYLSVAMLFYRQGNLLSKKDKIVEITSSLSETTRQFISQYYGHNIEPDEIYSNFNIETSIKHSVPQRGQAKKVLKIALTNAKDNIDLKLSEFVRREELTLGAVQKLTDFLHLKSINHILMIDNSNTSNTNPVSAIVSYRNGIKRKHEYKKYNLEVNESLGDVEYMRQGLMRYSANESNPIPDLLIVDGGKQQVNIAKKILPKWKVIGLVKNDNHATESIIDLNGRQTKIVNLKLLAFLKGIQIEVDRFAKYHHNVRRKTTLEGVLVSIKGIGDATERKLLEKFKTYSAIYNATEKQLSSVVGNKLAKLIKQKLQ